MHDGTSRDGTGQDGTLVRTGRDRWPPGRDAGGGHLAREAASTATNIAIPDDTPMVPRPDMGRRLVDLEVERHWRRLRLTATVPVPCGPGPCRCYGAELGRGA
jgi:hypothetical protein